MQRLWMMRLPQRPKGEPPGKQAAAFPASQHHAEQSGVQAGGNLPLTGQHCLALCLASRRWPCFHIPPGSSDSSHALCILPPHRATYLHVHISYISPPGDCVHPTRGCVT